MLPSSTFNARLILAEHMIRTGTVESPASNTWLGKNARGQTISPRNVTIP